MQLGTYHRNSLTYHRWSNLAVMMGVAVAAAVLIGALLVGDSMRGSLRETALRRLGPVDHALVGQRFFREAIAEGLASTPEFRSRFGQACPVMLITGGISHADTGARVNSVNVLGVDDRFWLLDDERRNAGNSDSAKRVVVLNEPLAEELGAKVGDDVLVRLQRRRLVPAETLLGRPDDVAMALRLTVDRIVPAAGMGGFSIRSNQRFPRNAFVPLPALQRATQQDGRVNAILVTGKPDAEKYPSAEQDNRLLQGFFKTLANPGDFDLRLRRNDALGYVSLETDRLLLEPAVEPEAFEAARAVGAPAVPILTYLANTIALMPAEKGGDGDPANRGNDAPPAIPYSTVTAIDPEALPSPHALRLANGEHAPTLDRRDILLSRWAADDLRADVGDRVVMTFFVTRSFGRLETVEAVFAVRGIVAIEGWAADAGLTPEFEGITNVQRLSDWDPPFPIDMNRIREKDEQYWSQYRATPKAFVSRQAGRELWTEGHAELGRLTSIRITAAPGTSLEETAKAFEEQLRRRLDPEKVGLVFQSVREQAIASSRGSTDFGGLFTAMSFFLIASAGLIIAIMFRLGVTQRAVEIGTLLALGFRRRRVMRILLLEGTIVAAFGILAGSAGAIGYAWLMLAGLRSASWWAGAVNTPFLELHTTPLSFAIGSAVAFIVAMIAIAWAICGLTRISARALLAGEIQSGRSAPSNKGRRIASGATVFSFLAAGALIVTSAATDALPRTGAFFASGTLMLVASVLGLWLWLAREHRELIREPGTTALLKLGMRNMGRNRGRTLMTIALIASATFVIVAVGANRHGAPRLTDDKQSPTGGFGLICETAVPLHRDLNTVEGRDALGLADSSANLLASTTVMPFRLKPGDDASCLNLFRIDRPTILGAPPAMIDRGGFKFAALLDGHQAENAQNPWLLLRRRFDDGAVPAIVDFNTAVWLLHLGLGQDFTITDEGGQAVQLRIVAMLAGSILQGELIVSEAAFAEMFPSVEGYAFFLIDTPVENAGRLQHALEHDLNRYGFDAASAEDRLVEYMAVENTYISTFQTLGGLGLLLGTIGLAAVMLRNVTERRSEFALLRCIGYRQSSLCWMVLFENAALLVLGLVAGTVSALLAVAPHAATSPGDIPWVSLAGTLLAVALVGLATGTVAVLFSLRTQVLSSLRAE
ncbi:MAG: ABC transporter permease [Planctomycetota bacterium]